MNFLKKFWQSDADKKKQVLVNQMSKLEQYIADNGVETVKNDPNNNFVKCGDIDEEHKVRREMNTQLVARPNDPALKAQMEQLLRKEFFLKVGEDKFVYLGNTKFLEFYQLNISPIIGLTGRPGSIEYAQQGNQFMNNYLYSINATTTVDPEKDETNTLLKTFLRAAEKRKAKEEATSRLSRHKQWNGEDNYAYALRIGRIKADEASQDLIDPTKCRQNFTTFLGTRVNAIIGIGERDRGKTIYDFLVASLGSTEGGFALDKHFRNQTNMSGYDISSRQQMAIYARRLDVQQGFIYALCVNEVALQILGTAHREDIEGGQSYFQQSDDYTDIYSKNVWKALRLCLECLEEYILKKYMPQLPDVPNNDQSPPPPPPPPPPPSAPPSVVGGKLKSRSKSIRKKRISHRKKRISHRKKKSHSHKRRTLKRRAVN